MAERGRYRVPEWSEVWPGLLILGVLLVISLCTFFTDAIRRATAEGPRLTLLAPEVGGLERGSEVWLAGTPSGRVLGLEFRPPGGPAGERVAIETVMLREAMPFLRGDARIRIGAGALLAPAVVKVGPGSERGVPVEDGDTLHVALTPDLEDFRNMADSVRTAFAGTREQARRLDEAIRDGRGSAALFLADADGLHGADSIVAATDRLRDAWEGGDGMARLARDDSLREMAGRLIDEVRRLADPETRPGALAISADVAAALDRLGDRAATIGTALERAEGTAGRAMRDSALHRNAEQTRALLDSLTVELGRNPLRWLRLRLF